MQIPVARGTNPEAPLAYRARCLDRTCVWPSEAVIAGVMSKCVNDFANQLRDDSRVADALRILAAKEMTARVKGDEVRREIAAQSLGGNRKVV